MKKLVCMLFVLALIASLSFSVFAASGINANEQAVLDKLSTGKVIGDNGWTFEVPQEYINTAKNYFAGDCDMTETEKDAILAYINKGMDIVKKEADAQEFSGTEYSLSKMSQAARTEVLELGKDACAEVDLNLVYDAKANEVVITPVDSETPVFESAPVIKTTGESFPVTAASVVAAVSVVLVMGTVAMFVVAKKNGLLVK